MTYGKGMFGGKFMPLHKGHAFCIETASYECDRVYAILFYDSRRDPGEGYLSPESRWDRLCALSEEFDNVTPARIDYADMVLEDGTVDWKMQTPSVLRICGNLNAVYSSEPSYGDYFSWAYPKAVHRLVDPGRTVMNISATRIRAMDEQERMRWII